MSQFGWTDCPPEIRGQLHTLVQALKEALRDNLVGVYLHGSLAMGCFNPQRSDLDLLGVTQTGMDTDSRRRVAELLLRHSGAPRPIEISLMRAPDIRRWEYPPAYEFHFGEDWRSRFEELLTGGGWAEAAEELKRDADLAAHITVTLKRGISLYGPPAEAVFPSVPPEDYTDSITSDFHWARARLAENPVYFVLNACRVLAYLLEGRITSKEEAGAWAVQALPGAFRGLISRALEVYRGKGADEDIAELGLEEFTQYARRHLNKTPVL